jgi:hypothetical protein
MKFERDDVKSLAQATIAWTTAVPESKACDGPKFVRDQG